MKIRVTAIAELEIPDEMIEDAYGTTDKEKIKAMELEQYQEWILENIASEKIEIL